LSSAKATKLPSPPIRHDFRRHLPAAEHDRTLDKTSSTAARISDCADRPRISSSSRACCGGEDLDFSNKFAIFETFASCIRSSEQLPNPKEEEDDPYRATRSPGYRQRARHLRRILDA
jgi:hypothetical protein